MTPPWYIRYTKMKTQFLIASILLAAACSLSSGEKGQALRTCPEFENIVHQYWKIEPKGIRNSWESDLSAFELLVEEAQCMVGGPLNQLEEILGSNYRSDTVLVDQFSYYPVEFAGNIDDGIVRLDLYVHSKVDTQRVQSIIRCHKTTLTREWD